MRAFPSSLVLALALAVACSDPLPAAFVAAATRVKTTPVNTDTDPYFAAPWPDDRRLATDGTLGTLDFPNPEQGPLFDILKQRADGLVHGWGTFSPVFMPFSGAIDPSTLPVGATASMADDSSIFLVAVDAASPAYGHRVPLEWKWFGAPTLFLPGNVLAARPVVGFPLLPKTTYAFVVTTRLHDAAGAAVGPEESFFHAFSADTSAAAATRDYLAPLAAALDVAKIPRTSVAGATVFTTQPILDELLTLRDAILAGPVPTSTDLTVKPSASGFVLFEGTYVAPYFLHGTPPYESEGGGFEYDADGKPVAAAQETMRLSVCIPHGAVPAGGFPAVFYSHGTGGDFRTVVEDDTCAAMAKQGLAAFGIDQVLHGPRGGVNASCFGRDVEDCFFNVVNAVAGRNLIRQSALDHVSLRRLVEGLTIPSTVDPEARTVTFDVRHAGFFGHSQGGLTGAIYAAISPDLTGALLSGAGAHLTTSLLVRDAGALKDLAESRVFMNLSGKESLEQFHPAVALIQTLGEVADPGNYSRYWIRQPQGFAKSMFLTSGSEDPYTPAASGEALAASGGLPQVRGGNTDSPLFKLAGLLPVDAPVHGNITLAPGVAVTGVFRQFPGQGHFPIFDDATARTQLGGWFRTLAADGVPTLVAP